MFNVSNAINVYVLQIPNDQNGNTAIVSGSVIMPDGKVVTDVSSYTPQTPFSHEDTLAIAKANVMRKVEERASLGGYGGRVDSFPSKEKSQMNGGGTKPASHNQLTFIRNKAQEQGRNAEELAASRFGKPLQELKGCEADGLIKELLATVR